MTTAALTKALSKHGEVTPGRPYTCTIGRARITFYDQNGRAHGLHVGRVGEVADSRSDYFPGSYFRTIKAAIAWAQTL